MAAKISALDIANRLTEEVHAGTYGVGEMLPAERDLCDRFGVGRTVRQNQLEPPRVVS